MKKKDKRGIHSYPQGLACIQVRGNRQYIEWTHNMSQWWHVLSRKKVLTDAQRTGVILNRVIVKDLSDKFNKDLRWRTEPCRYHGGESAQKLEGWKSGVREREGAKRWGQSYGRGPHHQSVVHDFGFAETGHHWSRGVRESGFCVRRNHSTTVAVKTRRVRGQAGRPVRRIKS